MIVNIKSNFDFVREVTEEAKKWVPWIQQLIRKGHPLPRSPAKRTGVRQLEPAKRRWYARQYSHTRGKPNFKFPGKDKLCHQYRKYWRNIVVFRKFDRISLVYFNQKSRVNVYCMDLCQYRLINISWKLENYYCEKCKNHCKTMYHNNFLIP